MAIEHEGSAREVFENPGREGGVPAIWFFLAGLGLIAFAVASFVAAVGARVGQFALHATTTLPVIVAVGLLARWASLRNQPERVVVDADGLEIATPRGVRRHPWSEIGSAAVANILNSPKTCLRITDAAGKTIIRIDESFPDFQLLARSVESRVDAKADDASARIMARKAKRMALLSFAMGCFLGFAAVFIGLQTREAQRANALLARKGAPGEGEIVRRFIAPNGVTRRIEYRVAGSGIKNVEVEPAFWDRLEGARTVAVVYVPDEPGVSRLASGEVKDDDFTKTPRGGYLLSAAGGLMALFMLGYAPIAWKGYDLGFDEKKRVWTVKRHGRAVWTSKGKPPTLWR